MPHALTDDGVQLYYEDTGSGETLVFVHEFAGDHRSWEPQVRYFARRYRCLTFDARGYPPSDVPADPSRYSQERAYRDIASLLDHVRVDKAHVIGLSMGGFATLHLGLNQPARAHSLVVAGCGYGAERDQRERFQREAEATADLIERAGAEAFARTYSEGPTRVQLQNKDPRGWAEFRAQLAEHSLAGAANTMRGVQRNRPSIFDLEAGLRSLRVPTLIMTGDEDEPCLVPNVFMKRVIPASALLVVPNCGHTINLEEPEVFNRAVDDFITQVRAGRWPMRDPRSLGGSILGVSKE